MDVTRLSVSDAFGYARRYGRAGVYLGMETETDILRKIVLEIAVNEDFLEPTIECISRVAHTGSFGDGKIFVLPMEEAIRIGETTEGSSAI